MHLQVDLRHVTYALADALDLVGIDDVGHGKRVGIMAAECARAAGLPGSEATTLFDLGLLHDVGVSSSRVHTSLVSAFEWDGADLHCRIGSERLETFPPLAGMAPAIRHHHTRWEVLKDLEVSPADARRANLIFLTDRVDALAAPFQAGRGVPEHADEIRGQIRARAGTTFDRDLVEQFLAASESDAFWLLLEPRAVQGYLQEMLSEGPRCRISAEEVGTMARIFARIVDAKSPFTAEHSAGVAGVARLLAERMGLDPSTCAKVEVAGLLHDLGKLRVPDEVLDKPAGLDPRERMAMHAHPFETFQILHRIPGFEEIAPWAAHHHEEPGGTGYPFHLDGGTLPVESRLLRVADIFQAMVQDRRVMLTMPITHLYGLPPGVR